MGQAGSGAFDNLFDLRDPPSLPAPTRGAGALTPPDPPKCNLL
jgi:hypothetical protein